MISWNTIDTAPMDGTMIMLYWPTMRLTDYPVVGANHGDGCGWDWVANRDYGQVYPTHWMPLPEPPK